MDSFEVNIHINVCIYNSKKKKFSKVIRIQWKKYKIKFSVI